MILNSIFNVQSGEWSKISFLWMIKFLFRISFVIVWTVIIALFVSRNGIYNLPFLFVFNALFSIFGSFVFSFFLHRIRREHLMLGIAIISILFFFVASFFSASFPQMFFAILLFSEAVFLVQFKIVMDGYIEEKFSPLSSERVFPVIESSETVAGIFGGILIAVLSDQIDTGNFIFFIIGTLLLLACLILILHFPAFRIQNAVKSIEPKHKKHVFAHLRDECFNSPYSSYVLGLFLIVLLQWLIFNLLEFQYTKAVYQSVSGVILEAGSGFEHVFVHELGQLFILFSASTLLVQFFLGSRIIKYLGVIGAMLLHAVVTFLSFLGLFLSFNFYTAILAKNNFSMTSALNTDAYQSAYYAISGKLRDNTRELLEGVVRPAGALLGTALLIFLQKFLKGSDLTHALNLLMLLFSVMLVYVSFCQQKRYTKAALNDLVSNEDLEKRLNAVSILSQKGHHGERAVMKNILLNLEEPSVLREAIFNSFVGTQNPKVIANLVRMLAKRKDPILMKVLKALDGLKVNVPIRENLVKMLKNDLAFNK